MTPKEFLSDEKYPLSIQRPSVYEAMQEYADLQVKSIKSIIYAMRQKDEAFDNGKSREYLTGYVDSLDDLLEKIESLNTKEK